MENGAFHRETEFALPVGRPPDRRKGTARQNYHFRNEQTYRTICRRNRKMRTDGPLLCGRRKCPGSGTGGNGVPDFRDPLRSQRRYPWCDALELSFLAGFAFCDSCDFSRKYSSFETRHDLFWQW